VGITRKKRIREFYPSLKGASSKALKFVFTRGFVILATSIGINWFRLRIYLYFHYVRYEDYPQTTRQCVARVSRGGFVLRQNKASLRETCPLTVADFRDSRYPVDTTTRLRHDSNAPVTRCNARGLARETLSLSSLSFFLSFFLSCARETAERRKLISHGRWTDIAAITLRGSGE